MDHADPSAAPPPFGAAPPQDGAGPDLLARLRATRPSAIVAVAFLVAVFAGVGVAGVEYWVHAQSVRGRALAELTAAPAQPAAASSPAAPVVAEASVPPPALETATEAAAPTAGRSLPRARKARSVRARPAPKPGSVKEVRKTGVAVATVEPRASEVPTKPATLDERYADAARKKCRSGALGLPCREMVRWRMCRGRWNDGGSPGETSCYVRREEAAFPPLVIGALHCPVMGN